MQEPAVLNPFVNKQHKVMDKKKMGRLHGWPLSEEAGGCPVLDTAGSSWLHDGPAAGQSCACQQSCSTSVKTYLRKAKTRTTVRSEGKKSVRSNPVETKAREGGGSPGVKADTSPAACGSFARNHGGAGVQPVKRTTAEEMITLQPKEDPTLEHVDVS